MDFHLFIYLFSLPSHNAAILVQFQIWFYRLIPSSRSSEQVFSEHTRLQKRFRSSRSPVARLFKFVLSPKQMFPGISRCFCCKALTDPGGFASNSLSLSLAFQHKTLRSNQNEPPGTPPPPPPAPSPSLPP